MESAVGNKTASRRIILPLVLSSLILVLLFGCSYLPWNRYPVVTGKKTLQEWKTEAGWNPHLADTYLPSVEKIQTISRLTQEKDISFIVFGGSWCPDTRAQLPVLYKLFELASIPSDRIELYGVDRLMKEPTGTAKRFHIERVPTLVFLSAGNETGRITERPAVSWEDDMIEILSK